jgi:hypothetical protein
MAAMSTIVNYCQRLSTSVNEGQRMLTNAVEEPTR